MSGLSKYQETTFEKTMKMWLSNIAVLQIWVPVVDFQPGGSISLLSILILSITYNGEMKLVLAEDTRVKIINNEKL